MRVVAVDWSGRRRGERRSIWLAEVHDGTVTRVEDGRSREEIVEHLLAHTGELASSDAAGRGDGLVVGFDFSFSLPAWFLRERGYASACELWDAAAHEAETWLTDLTPPFWGRRGCPRPDVASHLRETEAAVGSVHGIRPKSTFQVSGAGSVGAGSLRGFPALARLRAHGFSVWPFDDAVLPAVFEVWPRLLTGPVVKSDRDARTRYLDERFPELPAHARDPAVASDDAFDALVSALVMARHVDELCSAARRDDAVTRLEGAIWEPGRAPTRVAPQSFPAARAGCGATGASGGSTCTHPSPVT
jgi:hypothetical protein